jgi:hypothetical protein
MGLFIRQQTKSESAECLLRNKMTQEPELDITNSVALVRERTIPTERPPLVGEVSANVCG